jgi:hypothetical protein
VRRPVSPIVVVLLLVIACGGTLPWKMPSVPEQQPDEQYRTGVEAGEHVYLWNCHNNERILVTQVGSCFGTREPVVERGPCGQPLQGEARFKDVHRNDLPVTWKWQGEQPDAAR